MIPINEASQPSQPGSCNQALNKTLELSSAGFQVTKVDK